jgi:hypothetical protein
MCISRNRKFNLNDYSQDSISENKSQIELTFDFKWNKRSIFDSKNIQEAIEAWLLEPCCLRCRLTTILLFNNIGFLSKKENNGCMLVRV